MEKMTIKTEKVLAAHRVLSASKYQKLSDDDKIKVFKICVALKPIAKKFEEDSKDAAEKLKPCEDYDQKLQQAQEYERVTRDPKGDASTLEMGAAEYNDFIKLMNSNDWTFTEAEAVGEIVM